jgi:cytochrome P450
MNPVDENIDIYSSSFQNNFFTSYEKLRKQGEIVYLPKSNCYIVVGYNEVKQILSDNNTFSSAPLQHIDEILLGADLESHYNVRKILQNELGNLRKANLPDISELSQKTFKVLVENLPMNESVDLVYSLVNPFTFFIATEASGMINVPDNLNFVSSNENFETKIKNINRFFENWDDTYEFINPIVESIENNISLTKIFNEIQLDKEIRKDVLAKFIKMFVVAGTETTSSLIASALFKAISTKDINFKSLEFDSLNNSFINEVLRLYSPAQITFRKSTVKTKISDVEIPANALIAVSLGAANRDSKMFVNPEEFLLDRKNIHFAFGYGRHRCLGEHLGILITQSFLDNFFNSENHFIFQSEEIENHSFFTFKISKIKAYNTLKPAVILKDDTKQNFLKKKGYILLSSFLDKKTIKEILDYYEAIGLNAEKTQPNYLYAKPDLSKEISEKIKTLIQSEFDEEFASGNLLGGVFMVKKPGKHKEVDFHQDWSLVDESEHISYNLWCPLVDTEVESGALMIIDKSDMAGLPYRSSTFPPLEVKHEKKYDRFIKKFSLKAGDAILYKHSMFHGSDNNQSNFDRIAIACGVIPEDVPFVYQNWNSTTSTIDTYEVDRDFYINHIHEVLAGKIPEKYKIIKQVKFDEKPEVSESTFYKKLRKVHGIKRFFFFD